MISLIKGTEMFTYLPTQNGCTPVHSPSPTQERLSDPYKMYPSLHL